MQPKTALIVDNSKLVRSYIKELLQEEGFETIVEAGGVAEAIAAFDKHKPQFVTLDLLMPDGSGIKALEAMRSQDQAAAIVIVTDSNQKPVVTQAVQMGASAVVFKPFTKDNIKAALQQTSAPRPASKRKALIVDDSMVMRVLIREILEAQGCEIIGEAADVPQGIKAYQELKPDLMTLDLVMPGGSGIDVLKKVREFDPKANVIVVSAVSQEKVGEELLGLGAKAVLGKPVTPDRMREALAKISATAAADSVGISFPAPANGAAALSSDDFEKFRELIAPAAKKCAEGLGILSQVEWIVSGMDVYERSSYEMQAFATKIKDIVFVRMTVATDVPIMGLFGAPHDDFIKMAQQSLAPYFSSLHDPDAAIRLMILEWANIAITNFLNVMADALGYAVISSPPDMVDGSIEDAIRKASLEISDVAKKITFAHVRLTCASWAASCEVILMVRSDCLEKIVSKNA